MTRNPIPFYDKNDSYYEFTNFYPATINISEIPQNLGLSSNLFGEWKTSEHLFQAAKFTDENIIEEIRRSPDKGFRRPGGAFWLANTKYIGRARPSSEWFSINERVMHWIVKEKFTQNEELKKRLLETDDAELVEDSGKKDKFWGNGEKGNGIVYPFDERKGENKLGKILMEIREEIRSATKPETTEPETTGLTGEGDATDKEKQKKQFLIEGNIREIRAKLQEAGISSEQENKILNAGISTNNWERDYRKIWGNGSEEEIEGFKKALLKEINEFITKNSSNNNSNNNQNNNNNNGQNQNEGNQGTNEQPNQPEPSPSFSQPNPEPTQQQLNDVKDKLDQIKENSNEEDIIRIIKEVSNTIKNSGDENLKKQKEEAEKKLSKDKLREIISEEIKTVLTEEGVKIEELTPTVKQKLDELNNNNNNNNDQATRTEIFNEIGKTSLNKLISSLEIALKSGQKNKVESKVKELQQFINSKIDYKQNAYKLQKNKVDKLLAQSHSNQNKPDESFFRPNNPLMWLSGTVIIVLVVGLGLLMVRVLQKDKTRKK